MSETPLEPRRQPRPGRARKTVTRILDATAALLEEDLGLEPVEAYIDQFPLDQSYPWHKMRRKIQQVLVIHSRS